MRITLLSVIALTLGVAAPATAGEPCCGIVKIDAATGVVTARDLSSKRTFAFVVKDRAALRGLAVGQKVWADFGTRQVRIHEAEPCCSMTGLR